MELNKRKLIGGSGQNYVLYTSGLDVLALKYYADKDYAYALGKLIAKGKESDVYEILSSESKLYALKLFRLGRTSFREVRRKRASGRLHSWLEINYQAAEKEFHALSRLAGVSRNVPTAVAYNRHTVLLEELPGVRLSNRPDLVDPKGSALEIIKTVREIYLRAGLINADLSEYNIITDGQRIWLIDWPQWISKDHPNAQEMLTRDVSSVLGFFRRVYGLESDAARVMAYVTGKGRVPAFRRV